MDRRLALFAAFAAAGIAPLMVKLNLVVAVVLTSTTPVAGVLSDDVKAYLPLAAPIIALVVWHRQPARSWPWLLVAGSVFSIPLLLNALGFPLRLTGITADVVDVLLQCAPAANLVGVLGAACWLHQRGRRTTAAAVTGTAVLSQLVGAAVLLTAGYDAHTFSRVTVVALFLIGAAGAVGAAVLSLRVPMPVDKRPAVRTTVIGAAGAASAALLLAWQPNPLDETANEYYFVELGLVLLAIGVVLGALGGPRLLLGAAAAGLLVGPLGMMVTPAVEVLDQFTVVSVIAVLASMATAYATALSRFRLPTAVVGLTVVAAGMALLLTLFTADDPLRPSDTFDQVFTPILVVIGVIAAGCGIASVGSATADEAASPAVLAGASTPFALGAIVMTTHFIVHRPDDTAKVVGLLPPVIVGVLIAAALLVVLAKATGQGAVDPAGERQAEHADRQD